MELVTGLDTQIFVIFLGVVVALGCTLIAFLVDYLKGKNERLREQVLEMTVRQEERARYPQAQLDSTAVLSAIAQVGRNLEVVVRTAMHPESVAEAPSASQPVYQPRPAAEPAVAAALAASVIPMPEVAPEAEVKPAPEAEVQPEAASVVPVMLPVVEETPAAPDTVDETVELSRPAAIAESLAAEPDWRTATWHEEAAQASIAPADETPVADQPAEEPLAESAEPQVTTKPIREALRSLFDNPASVAAAAQLESSQLEMERRLNEAIPEVEAPVAEVAEESEEPVVRIRVLNNNVATPLTEETVTSSWAQEAVQEAEEVVAQEEVIPEPVAVPATEEVMEEVAQEPVAETEPEIVAEGTIEAVEEVLPVTAPVDFLSPADFGENPPAEPLESFDSLMAAVNAEPSVAPEVQEPETAPEAEEPGVLALPSGMNDRATLDFLKRDTALFTGLIVSIGINDYARLQETSGRPAAEDLAKSVSQLVKSLITAPNGSEFFGCRASDDEFILVFANENGSVAQRRLNALSERLWDFQLRSLGNFSVMFSWGATEANSETFADAVEAASERMRETRHNRRTISMEKTRLKKVVNG